MKKTKKIFSVLLTLCMVLAMMPLTAYAGPGVLLPLTVGEDGNYATLEAALSVAEDGDTITLLNDITESVIYTVDPDTTITIDGAGFKITGTTTAASGDEPEYSVALTLAGTGSINLKKLTLQGGTAAGMSVGLVVQGAVNVQSYNTVAAFGGSALNSCGLLNVNSGMVNVTTATGETEGVLNQSSGTVNVTTATGTGADSTGVYNAGAGTVNVTTATGVKSGVYNASTGTSTSTVNVITATATGAGGAGVSNAGNGTVNVATAIGTTNSVYNDNGSSDWGTVNAKTANGSINNSGRMNVTNANGSILNFGTMNVGTLTDTLDNVGTINTGADTRSLILNKGFGASCILDYITVAATADTTIGTLPSVYKDGKPGVWYSNADKTTPFHNPAAAGTTLYSDFCISVTGRIVDTLGTSGLAATLQLKNSAGNNVGSAVTAAADGTFAILDVPAGTDYTITISMNGYATDSIEAFDVKDKTVSFKPFYMHLPLTVGTEGSYPTLAAALAIAHDGDTITLLNNITESVEYNGGGRVYTLDGQGYTVTGVSGNFSIAMILKGSGTMILKNITLQGGTATGSESMGLLLQDSYNVKSEDTVSALGGTAAIYSYGLTNSGTGTVDVTNAIGGDGFSDSFGAVNSSSGTVNVNTASADINGQQGTGYGVSNFGAGTINVNKATGWGIGNGHGVQNNNGTVNVNDTTGTSGMPGGNYGVYFMGTGMVNAGIVTGDIYGAGTLNTGASVASITLNKGIGTSCVLDSITVAATGDTTIGTLPSVIKNGVAGKWFTNSAKTTVFSGTTVTAATTLYSTFYSAATGGGGGGGGGTTVKTPAAAPAATTATTGTTTIATAIATAAIGLNGSAAASVTADQLTDAIDKAVAGAKGTDGKAFVEIKVEGTAKSTSISTTIPQVAFKNLSNSSADGFKISTPLGTILFDNAAMSAINKNAAGDIKVTVAQVDTSKLTEAEKAAVGDRPVYDLTVNSGNTTISSFGSGSATISVPYTLAAGEDANKIIIYYLSDSGDLVLITNCSYDATTGKVTFITNHFSEYAVGYNNVSFSDVSGWYADSVNYLAARGILSGSNGKFNPNSDITRAEFVTILANLAGADLSGYTTSSFTDVATTKWFFGAIQWANKNGIAVGSGGEFHPNARITRQDMAVMIDRYVEKVAKVDLASTTKAVEFADKIEIADYAKTAVSIMQQAGIVAGKDNNQFDPTANATRAETAKMMASLLRGLIK